MNELTRWALPAAVWAAALLLVVPAAGCRRAPAGGTPDVVAARASTLPEDPLDPAWRTAPEHVAILLPQDLVEPRLLEASVRQLRVRSLTDGKRIAFLLRWTDPTRDDLPGAARFDDACAVQVPAAAGPGVPAPQMGEPGRTVEVTYWRASWQATVDGRGDSIADLYPNASIDHYPFEAAALEKGSAAQVEAAARYAPARALSNPMAGPRESPVEDLVADGPGTLRRADRQESRGRGRRAGDGWAVTITRDVPEELSGPAPGQVAFAVWEGSRGETGSRKMRTGWIPLVAEALP